MVARAALCTITGLAYDEDLAGRIRQLIGSDPELTELKMFGGLAFFIRGNMSIATSSEGGAMVRVDPAQSDSLLAARTATLVNMRGRDMPGWLRISSDDLRAHDGLLRPRDLVDADLSVGLVYPYGQRFHRLDLWLADQTTGLSVADQILLLRRAAEGVAYAHRNPVVHRGTS